MLETLEEINQILGRRKWPSVMGSAGFADSVKKKFFSKKRHKEVPESKLLAPDVSVVRDMVCRSYGVKEKEHLALRRGRPNEARNVAIYLLRQLRCSKLKEIGTKFGISSYSTVSTIIERTRNEIPIKVIVWNPMIWVFLRKRQGRMTLPYIHDDCS